MPQEYLIQLMYWSDALSKTGFFQDMLWYNGWCATIFLRNICNVAEASLQWAYNLLDFTNYDIVNKVLGGAVNWKAILAVLFALGLIILGYTLILSKEQKPQFLQSFILLLVVFLALPTLFSICNDLVLSTKSYILGENQSISSSDEGKASDQIVLNSITDYLYIEDQELQYYGVQNSYAYPKEENRKLNNLSADMINYIDINEKIEITDDDERIFNYKIQVEKDGEVTAVPLNVSSTGFDWLDDLFNENYRRYDVKFFSVWTMLICMSIALIFTSFKMVRIIYELLVNRCLAMIISPVDLTTGRKTKVILQNILSSYVIMVLAVIFLKIFIEFYSFIQTSITSSFIQALCVIAITLAVIDGPRIVERIFGIDAGVQSGYKTTISMFMAARLSTKLVSGAFGLGREAVRSAGRHFGENSQDRNHNINSADSNNEEHESNVNQNNDNHADVNNENNNNLSSTDGINGNKSDKGSAQTDTADGGERDKTSNIDSSNEMNNAETTNDDNNDNDMQENSDLNNNISSAEDINNNQSSNVTDNNDGHSNISSAETLNRSNDYANEKAGAEKNNRIFDSDKEAAKAGNINNDVNRRQAEQKQNNPNQTNPNLNPPVSNMQNRTGNIENTGRQKLNRNNINLDITNDDDE